MNKRFKRIYVEITNHCNLNCSFCIGHNRKQENMTIEQFEIILKKVKDYTDYIYYHVMGEPLLNNNLKQMLNSTKQYGLKSCITTNGTLLKDNGDCLIEYADNIHQLSISLQAQQGNNLKMDKYIDEVCQFGLKMKGKSNVCYRLWNIGGIDKDNDLVLEKMKQYYPKQWRKNDLGYCIDDMTYIEFANKFNWPDLNNKDINNDRYYCYGLKSQIAILVDGTVVPCCLDHNGDINLGNIFENDLETIINSDRAISIIKSFEDGKAVEKLCQRCEYASRFTKKMTV